MAIRKKLLNAHLIALVILFIDAYILQGTAQRFALPALGWAAGRRPTGKILRRRKLLEIAADWASERQANIAQPKRVSAGHPQRRVHALLGVFE
jgi:hypothetical protein